MGAPSSSSSEAPAPRFRCAVTERVLAKLDECARSQLLTAGFVADLLREAYSEVRDGVAIRLSAHEVQP